MKRKILQITVTAIIMETLVMIKKVTGKKINKTPDTHYLQARKYSIT